MVVVYDIEVLRNFFLYVDYDIETKQFHTFEISVFADERKALLEHLKGLKAQIGFNNLGYDAQIMQYFFKHKGWKELSALEVADKLHDYSQYVISARDENRFPDFREFYCLQLDLFKVWHYDNKARSCSLKFLQYSMDWPNIEDMPIDHRSNVTDAILRDKIRSYCKNDVLSTYEFYKITKGETNLKLYKNVDKIQLRKDIQRKFGFNCINFSDVKIGDEINKTNYLKATGKEWMDIKGLRTSRPRFTFGDCYPSYMEFETPELKGFFERIKDIYIDVNSMQNFVFKFDGVEYTIAKGGLHSKDKPRKIVPRRDQILRDADVGSMYPNAILKRGLYPQHLGIEWLNGYADIIRERLESKRLYKETGGTDKSLLSIVEAYKLALNGGSFGKTGEKTNWQYDLFITFAVTIGCQIDLLMFIEDLVMNGIRVMTANTDGVVCLFNKDQEDTYKRVCAEWEKQVGNDKMGQLEYADYALLAQLEVNSYIAVQTDGKAKHKGDFMVDYELHKNKSFRVVSLALDAYYTKGINPVKFIKEHNNIFDFCAVVRAKGSWQFETRAVKEGEYVVNNLQKTNRYYISKSGSKLIKSNESDKREQQVDAGKWLCTVYNIHEDKPIDQYDINYDFYIEETYKIISLIEPDVLSPYSSQLSLFV